GYAPGTYQVVAYAVDGSGNNPSLGGSPKSWTVQAHTWYKMTIGNKTLYIQKPDSASSNMEARVSDNGSSYAVVYNYTNGEWTSNNTYASIPGSGGGATVTSLDEIQNVNTLGMFDDIIVDVTDKVDQVKAILLNSLGFDEAAMTTADWRMVNLGITTGIIDSTFADPSLWNWLVNNKNIKALVFKVAGITELQAEDDYYYIKSKAYTEYGIMVAARVIEYGSIAAAAAALTQAGVSFVGGLAVLAGSGGTGAPIALAIEVESVGALVASGVCTLVGSAAGVVADKAQAAMNSDESKFAKFAEEDEELQKVDKNYKRTFFAEHPELEFNVVVHHAIEQQVLTKYPGLFTESEIQSYSNLRGIPKEVNSDIHLSKIRKEWNRFYSAIDDGDIALTKENFLNKAAEIDRLFGSSFKPSR
ncbi:hypothetical protein J2X61_005569, partial [Bacillus sp. 3255]|nr:hypothetical protein [Bacillus sp. 3255]